MPGFGVWAESGKRLYLDACVNTWAVSRLLTGAIRFFFISAPDSRRRLPRQDWWAACPRRDVFPRLRYVSRHQELSEAKKKKKKKNTELNEEDEKRPSPTSAIMMSMNSKQAFSMHPILHEPKYTPLHSSSEAIRRACLPTPSVRSARFTHARTSPSQPGIRVV